MIPFQIHLSPGDCDVSCNFTPIINRIQTSRRPRVLAGFQLRYEESRLLQASRSEIAARGPRTHANVVAGGVAVDESCYLSITFSNCCHRSTIDTVNTIRKDGRLLHPPAGCAHPTPPPSAPQPDLAGASQPRHFRPKLVKSDARQNENGTRFIGSPEGVEIVLFLNPS